MTGQCTCDIEWSGNIFERLTFSLSVNAEVNEFACVANILHYTDCRPEVLGPYINVVRRIKDYISFVSTYGVTSILPREGILEFKLYSSPKMPKNKHFVDKIACILLWVVYTNTRSPILNVQTLCQSYSRHF